MTEIMKLYEFERNEVVVDDAYAHGRAAFKENRIGIRWILGALRAGDSVESIMQGYGVTLDQVHEVIEVELSNPGYVARVDEWFDLYEQAHSASALKEST